MVRTIIARLECIFSFRIISACTAVCSRSLASELGSDVLIGALPGGWRGNIEILEPVELIVCKKSRLRGGTI